MHEHCESITDPTAHDYTNFYLAHYYDSSQWEGESLNHVITEVVQNATETHDHDEHDEDDHSDEDHSDEDHSDEDHSDEDHSDEDHSDEHDDEHDEEVIL